MPAPAPTSAGSPQIPSPQTRVVPKKLFIVNGMPSPDSPPTATLRSGQPSRSGGSYGAMGTPRGMNTSPAPTFSSQSTMMTARTPMAPAVAWNNGSGAEFSQRRLSRPEALQLPNPFLDPVSRPGTADTAYTALSYNSSTSSFGPRGDTQQLRGRDMVYLSPFQIPALPFDEEKGGRPPVSPGGESIYSLYSSDSPRDDASPIDLEKAASATMTHAHYLTPPNATVRQTMSFPSRMHTATPHSVHSVAPSVDWTSEQQSQPQQIATPVNMMPPPVHARAASDPVYRPYTASPRMVRPQEPLTTYAAPDNTVLLPNPFPMVGSANIRRYTSIGHTRAQLSYPGSAGHADVRNAHLQAAMGRAPPRTQTYPVPVNSMGRAPSKKMVSRAEWKQLVINAASSR